MDVERANRGPPKNSGAEPFSALRDKRAAQLALRPFTKTSTATMDVSPFMSCFFTVLPFAAAL